MPRCLFVTPVVLALAGCTEPRPEDKVPRFTADDPDRSAKIEAVAREYLALDDRFDDVGALEPRRAPELDPLGTAHVRLDQYVGGIPVSGGQAVVHVPPDGQPIRVTDGLVHQVDVDLGPGLTSDEAVAIARAHADQPEAELDGAELVIVRVDDEDHLAWHVALRNPARPSLPIALVDAHRGAVVEAYDNLQTARDRRTYDAKNTGDNPNNTPSMTPAREESDPAIGHPAVDAAHDYTGITWDYYQTFHGLDSYDDAGAPVLSVADWGPHEYNAYWNGSLLVYGDGGSGPSFAEAIDVVAHEFTHAVTTYSAGLVYNKESGGLNEATSDIMSAVVESWDLGWVVNDTQVWRVGNGLGNGIRAMQDPASFGDVDSYDDYHDGLGVHTSSGIANRAFVGFVEQGLDIEDAGQVWYHALRYYMTPRTSFADARAATQQAAFDLFGASAVAAVANGWILVDVPGTPAFEVFDQVGPLSMLAGQSQTYTFTTSSSATAVRFLLVGDDGDADLYVSRGSTAPTPTSNDCASTGSGSREICTFDPATPGDYTVLVEAVGSFNDARLYAWEAVPGGVVCTDNDGDGVTTCEGDCDDTQAAVRPGVDEVCNGVDDDCDRIVDGPTSIDALTWYADADGDSFGDPLSTTPDCVQPDGFVANADDCDDASNKIRPGALEVCNLADDDCDGVVDGPTASGAVEWWADTDRDGYGDPNDVTLACFGPDDTVRNPDDCDDDEGDVHPGALETCNGIDDDCDGVTDPETADGTLTWYEDVDGDGFGIEGSTTLACAQPAGFAAVFGDCDDAVATTYPGAPELCNGVDDDCNNLVDPQSSVDAPAWYPDRDHDGYGDPAGPPFFSCTGRADYVDNDEDCDDTDGAVSPGELERCDASDVDEDCDGDANEADAVDALAYWRDVDGDGFGDPTTEAPACTWPSDAVPAYGLADCDDAADAIFPGADEVCDGIDNDCDEEIDNDAVDFGVYYVDEDGDGFGSEPIEACDPPAGTVTVDGDCDDADAGVNPDADDIADDGIDQDCDGTDREGVTDPGEDPVDDPEPRAGRDPEPMTGCATQGAPALPGSLALGLLVLLGRRRR